MFLRHSLFLIASLALALPLAARATVFMPQPFPVQVENTPNIARGTTSAGHADWGTEGTSKKIYTFYDFRVSEGLKGDMPPSGNIVIREMGGEKDGLGLQVNGAAHFAPGEDVVVFLGEQNDDGSFDLRGLASGKFNLRKNARGDECLQGIGVERPNHDGTVPEGAEPEKVEKDERNALSGDVSGQCDWTLVALRDLAAKQGGLRAQPESPVKTGPSPAVNSLPTLINGTRIPAPQLQSPSPEAEESSGSQTQGWFGKAAAVLAIGSLLAFLFFRSRGSK